MSTTFRPYAPDQSLLLPPDVRAWLPEGHLAHHVSDLRISRRCSWRWSVWRELGLASFGKLSIDGTKVRANASKRKAMSYGRMQEEERRLVGEIQGLLEAAGDADAAEDARLGADERGDDLPAELRRREDRLRGTWRRAARVRRPRRAI